MTSSTPPQQGSTATGGSTGAAQPTSAAARPASGAPGPLGAKVLAALQAVMAAEHAALWSYGLVTAYDPEVADTVTAMVTSHQGVRDMAANLIVQGGATPVGPEPAYRTPEPMTGKKSALALALSIEENCARAWLSVIGMSTDSTLRGTALAALSDCAMRMVTWRKTAGDAIVTVPFPGAPEMNKTYGCRPVVSRCRPVVSR